MYDLKKKGTIYECVRGGSLSGYKAQQDRCHFIWVAAMTLLLILRHKRKGKNTRRPIVESFESCFFYVLIFDTHLWLFSKTKVCKPCYIKYIDTHNTQTQAALSRLRSFFFPKSPSSNAPVAVGAGVVPSVRLVNVRLGLARLDVALVHLVVNVHVCV